MSRLIDRILRVVFVVGVVAALAVGGQAAFAADRVTSCPCDPNDPKADQFCASDECCGTVGSVCTSAGICICA